MFLLVTKTSSFRVDRWNLSRSLLLSMLTRSLPLISPFRAALRQSSERPPIRLVVVANNFAVNDFVYFCAPSAPSLNVKN
jgi:hypothetical protein